MLDHNEPSISQAGGQYTLCPSPAGPPALPIGTRVSERSTVVSTCSILFSFNCSWFSDTNGAIKFFTVVVTESKGEWTGLWRTFCRGNLMKWVWKDEWIIFRCFCCRSSHQISESAFQKKRIVVILNEEPLIISNYWSVFLTIKNKIV